MKQYKVLRQSFIEEKSDKDLQKIAVSTISVIKENLTWKEAMELRRANKGSFIAPQHEYVATGIQ